MKANNAKKVLLELGASHGRDTTFFASNGIDAAAINTKIQPFPTEPLIMALLLSQHKMIDWLTYQIKLRQK